jgi:hypothetical protein
LRRPEWLGVEKELAVVQGAQGAGMNSGAGAKGAGMNNRGPGAQGAGIDRRAEEPKRRDRPAGRGA